MMLVRKFVSRMLQYLGSLQWYGPVYISLNAPRIGGVSRLLARNPAQCSTCWRDVAGDWEYMERGELAAGGDFATRPHFHHAHQLQNRVVSDEPV